MKLPLILILFLSFSANAQNLSSNILGDWEATCVIEKVDTNKLEVCGLCPYVEESENSISISTITFNFGNEELTIITALGSTNVQIQYNEKTEHLVFAYDGDTYDFSVMYVDVLSKIILKNNNGNILYLERKNNLRSK
jgi:hypothetical protein